MCPRVNVSAFFCSLATVQGQQFTFDDSQTLLKNFCQNCHQGKSPVARLDITRYATADSVVKEPQTRNRILLRVREGSMPPKGVPAPTAEQREKFSALVESTLRSAVCAAGPSPGPAPIRRLNRNQYSTTIRDLLNFQFNAGRALPEDGAGGEGFDNAAETLFLSPSTPRSISKQQRNIELRFQGSADPPGDSHCDGAFRAVSAQDPGGTSPLAREIDPRLVFERLFRAGRPQSDSAKQDMLLLDRVLDDARELRQRLGVADRQRMDEYLSVVRSPEERLERASRPQPGVAWKPRTPLDPKWEPAENSAQFADYVRLMLDMIAVAFQTDTTRICTFMFNNEVSNQNFSFVDGVCGGHHSTSHHQNRPEQLKQYQRSIAGTWPNMPTCSAS